MNASLRTLLTNPIWHALNTRHRHLAVVEGEAWRYPKDVVPFAAVAERTVQAMQQLHSLLTPGEAVWLAGTDYPAVKSLRFLQALECVQMVLPPEVSVPASDTPEIAIERMHPADAPAMVRLTDVAFPGFFRARTYRMGEYFGVRGTSNSELIAMGGERLALPGHSEVSAICTHPEHRGRGLAAGIIWKVVAHQRAQSMVSWLHVSAGNTRAIDLYRRLGFVEASRLTLSQLSRA